VDDAAVFQGHVAELGDAGHVIGLQAELQHRHEIECKAGRECRDGNAQHAAGPPGALKRDDVSGCDVSRYRAIHRRQFTGYAPDALDALPRLAMGLAYGKPGVKIGADGGVTRRCLQAHQPVHRLGAQRLPFVCRWRH
jgi:hypothetical protein